MTAQRDIIVVGAGIIGCSVAYELARRGASVQVIDARATGMGATQASAGMLVPFIEAGEGSALFGLAVRSLHLFDEFVARAAHDSGIQVGYRRTGSLQVATDEQGMTALRNLAARLDLQGVPFGLLDAHAVHAEEPYLAADIVGGLFIPAHGFVHVGEFTRALAAAARHHGAQVIEGSRVRRISTSGDDVVVETERGPLAANAVVLAGGCWSSQIEIAGASASVPVRPVRGQLLQLAWSGPPLRRITWGPRCYLVPWDNGTLLVGATVEEAGYDERTTAAGVRDLLEAVCDLLPHAWTAGFVEARVGLRPANADELPIIGRSTAVPGLMYATGHYRNGVMLAPLTAQIVADAMLEGQIDPALAGASPQRFGAL